MIAGNPKAGRSVAAVALAILFLVLAVAAWVGLRKRDVPQKEPPLHPETLLLKLRSSSPRLSNC